MVTVLKKLLASSVGISQSQKWSFRTRHSTTMMSFRVNIVSSGVSLRRRVIVKVKLIGKLFHLAVSYFGGSDRMESKCGLSKQIRVDSKRETLETGRPRRFVLQPPSPAPSLPWTTILQRPRFLFS